MLCAGAGLMERRHTPPHGSTHNQGNKGEGLKESLILSIPLISERPYRLGICGFRADKASHSQPIVPRSGPTNHHACPADTPKLA